MTNQTETPHKFGIHDLPENFDYVPNGGRVPSLTGDLRHLIPKLGLREYWYPLCGAGRVKKNKPLRVRMLGEDICIFQGKAKGEINAIGDICPHRGARLSEGDCHFAGTVACPYHGWVFDGAGNNVANLSEGVGSIVCGKPGTEARAYPTRVLKGVVFIWMGEGEPAPIEEDVGEEFFRDDVHIFFNERIYWKTNWEVGLENTMDSHVQYLHRDYLMILLGGDSVSPGRQSSGVRPFYNGYGFSMGGGPSRRQLRGLPGAQPGQKRERQAMHEGVGKWPKHTYRRYWNWLFRPWFYFLRVESPLMKTPHWAGGHHLPAMVHGGALEAPPKSKDNIIKRLFKTDGAAGIAFGQYIRQMVPVDEWLTRVWYHHGVVTRNKFELARAWFIYWTWARWHCDYNFSQQDMSVMLNLDYSTPEKLSVTDAEVVQWRRFVVTKYFGGRDAPFEYKNPEPGEPRMESPDFEVMEPVKEEPLQAGVG